MADKLFMIHESEEFYTPSVQEIPQDINPPVQSLQTTDSQTKFQKWVEQKLNSIQETQMQAMDFDNQMLDLIQSKICDGLTTLQISKTERDFKGLQLSLDAIKNDLKEKEAELKQMKGKLELLELKETKLEQVEGELELLKEKKKKCCCFF